MSDSTEPKKNSLLPKLRYAALTPEQRDADIWAEEILHERLPRTRELAQQWQTTVSAITALLGAGTLINADNVVRSLYPPGWSLLYGVLVGLALVSAAASILLASLAGQASWSVIPPGARERLVLREDLVTHAHKLLQWSRRLAGIALILLICAFAVRWYAPEKPATKALSNEPKVVASALLMSVFPNGRAVAIAPLWKGGKPIRKLTMDIQDGGSKLSPRRLLMRRSWVRSLCRE